MGAPSVLDFDFFNSHFGLDFLKNFQVNPILLYVPKNTSVI